MMLEETMIGREEKLMRMIEGPIEDTEEVRADPAPELAQSVMVRTTASEMRGTCWPT